MSRWKASGIHLLLSITTATVVALLLFFVWYPGPLFRASGGERLTMLLLGIDIVIGPLLTLIVFKAGKRGLKFDLSVIGCCQIAALLYGLNVITTSRPVFLVFGVDRFIAVSANQLEDADLAQARSPEFASRSWSGPRLVAAVMPKDDDEQMRLLDSAMRGKDIERFPKYFESYESHRKAVLDRLQDLDVLRKKSPAAAALVDDFLADRSDAGDLGFLPLVARNGELAAVLSRQDARIVGYIETDPW
jgi:hypothetical protein